MDEISYLQKLDTVLNFLKGFENEPPFVDSLPNRIKIVYRCDISLEEIKRIIGKLKEDGYVEVPHIQYVRISFNGYIFEEAGGYEAKALKDANDALLIQMEVDRRRTLDALLATNSTRLNGLTSRLFWATLVASVVAFALLVWQIYSFYHPAPIPVNLKI